MGFWIRFWNRIKRFLFGPQGRTRSGVPAMERDTRPNAPAGSSAAPESVNETIWYRTADGRHDIKFWFKHCPPNGWRAYIMSDINYGVRDTGAHATHRLFDSALNLQYICWNTAIQTKAQCKTVAAQWSDLTIKYINEGRRFG